MSEQIKFQSKMMMLKPNDIKHDPRYQRPISASRVKRFAKKFDPAGIGALHVSDRGSGGFFVVDGLHRREILKAVGLGDKPVRCIIYEGLTVAQEAALFRLLNQTEKTRAFDDFHAGITEGDAECRAINDICKKHGVVVCRTTQPNNISCIVELRSIYRKAGGDKALDTALGIIQKAWQNSNGALEKPVVGGLSRFLLEHGDQIEISRLESLLAKYGGGPAKIINQAKYQAENIPGIPGIAHAASKIILSIYNSGLRSGRLAA